MKFKTWDSKKIETTIAIVLLIGIVLIGLLVHYRLSFLNFFFLPVIIAGYYLGKKRAVLAAVACILLEALYLVASHRIFGARYALSFDDIISVVTWASFLILTAAAIGSLAEKRDREIFNLKKAYTGVLAIVLKYLEVAEKDKSRPERVSILAGKIAEGMGLGKSEVENVKSASLLSEVQELKTFLPVFMDTSKFMETENVCGTKLSDNEKVLLKTTAALLEEIHPIIEAYFVHYGQKDSKPPDNLEDVPLGASIIALAESYERLKAHGSIRIGDVEVHSPEDFLKLRGTYFPDKIVEVLLLLT